MNTNYRAKRLILPVAMTLSALAASYASNANDDTRAVLAEQFSYSSYPAYFSAEQGFSHNYVAVHTDIYYTEQQTIPAHSFDPETLDQLQDVVDHELELLLEADYPELRLALNW